MLGIQLYLESKESRKVIRELAKYITQNAFSQYAFAEDLLYAAINTMH